MNPHIDNTDIEVSLKCSSAVVNGEQKSPEKRTRGGAKDWSNTIGTFDTIEFAKEVASNDKQYTGKSNVMKCVHHVGCKSERKVVLKDGKYVIKQTPDEHTTELLVFNEGFPRIIRDVVDKYLGMIRPLLLCNKLEQLFKEPGYELHQIAFKKLLLPEIDGEYDKINLMIKARAAYVKKHGLDTDEIKYRSSLEDFLTKFEVK
jgi:hypothetical protein